MIISINKTVHNTVRKTTFALASAAVLSACATTATPPAETVQVAAHQEAPTRVQAADFYYTVERGDRLSSIAKQFTGNKENWTAIADASDVSDPRKLRIGQQLVIPGYLLPPVESTTRIASVSTTPATVALQTASRPGRAPVRNPIDDVGPDTAQVELKKADPNKRFVLRPLGTEFPDEAAQLEGNDYIKIIGSYFPKVVYQTPQLNAKLLMRVAPGATFPLEKLDDGWYQISTEKGSGYLRLEDGKPTGAKS